jgi:hypothetical protein
MTPHRERVGVMYPFLLRLGAGKIPHANCFSGGADIRAVMTAGTARPLLNHQSACGLFASPVRHQYAKCSQLQFLPVHSLETRRADLVRRKKRSSGSPPVGLRNNLDRPPTASPSASVRMALPSSASRMAT